MGSMHSKVWVPITFFLPAAFVALLAFTTMAYDKSAWPPFYSFLPMAFLLLGFVLLSIWNRVLRIERALALREESPVAGGGSPQALSGKMDGVGHPWSDPVGYAHRLVSTPARFYLNVALAIALPVAVLAFHVKEPWWTIATWGAIVAMPSVQTLIALRAVLRIASPGALTRAG